jgi:hypothetical protein
MSGQLGHVGMSGPLDRDLLPSVSRVDTSVPHAPDLRSFARTVAQVQSYVRSEPGAYSALVTSAHEDPAGTTTSLVALGTVLLDIAAGAFSLTPEEMLAKVSAGIAGHQLSQGTA